MNEIDIDLPELPCTAAPANYLVHACMARPAVTQVRGCGRLRPLVAVLTWHGGKQAAMRPSARRLFRSSISTLQRATLTAPQQRCLLGGALLAQQQVCVDFGTSNQRVTLLPAAEDCADTGTTRRHPAAAATHCRPLAPPLSSKAPTKCKHSIPTSLCRPCLQPRVNQRRTRRPAMVRVVDRSTVLREACTSAEATFQRVTELERLSDSDEVHQALTGAY